MATGSAIALAMAAAVTDIRGGVISNRLTYPAAILGLVIGLWPSLEPSFPSSVLGLLVAFVPAAALFAVGTMGGGDVKLLAAVGALLGYPAVLDMLFLSVVAGCALSICLIVMRGQGLRILREIWAYLTSLVVARAVTATPGADIRIPFAAAVLVAVVWTVARARVPGAGTLGVW